MNSQCGDVAAYVRSGLSKAEHAVIELVAQGMTAKAIARRLCRSDGTVKLQCSAAFKKMGARNRVQAALLYHGIDVREKANDT